jgi:hypothetical protein
MLLAANFSDTLMPKSMLQLEQELQPRRNIPPKVETLAGIIRPVAGLEECKIPILLLENIS